MNRLLKGFIGIICGAVATAGACAFAACGGAGNGNGTAGGGFYSSDYIVTHTEGQTVTYSFEAENTDLTNKSGPGFSGTFTEKQMVLRGEGASANYCVTGMNQNGNSLNFIIASDRDVTDATLILRLGADCKFSYTFNADTFRVRIDPVNDEDVKDYLDGGAWGNWDQFFLDYYDDDNPDGQPFAGIYLDEYSCGDVTVTATSDDPSGFADFIVCTDLKLQAGLNCISLITNNNEAPVGASNATYKATAPIVDCIKITTSAQLGLYNPQDNLGLGVGSACTFA